MNEQLNREEIVSLLERLGGDDDADVLEAARALHAMVTAAGVAWSELLTGHGAKTADSEEAGADRPAESDISGGADSALALIERLLARPGITDEFRREMEAYKSDIAEGVFADTDHSYLVALDKRLSAKG